MTLMKSTTVKHTMDALKTVFASCDLPEQLVSDNGQQFTSEAFAIMLFTKNKYYCSSHSRVQHIK